MYFYRSTQVSSDYMKNIYIYKYTTTFVYLDCYHYFTSDAHPVVRPETLLFPNETYIFFLSVTKKSVISFSSRQITFWIVTIISPLINYPLSVFFFFINSDKISRWMFRILSTVHIFYGITTTRWFHLHRIRSERDKFIAVERVELLVWVRKLFWENNPLIFTPYHRQVWRVYIYPLDILLFKWVRTRTPTYNITYIMVAVCMVSVPKLSNELYDLIT